MHVLIVDDERAVAEAIHRLLRAIVPPEWTVHHTTDPVEGRALLVLDPRVRICICDVLMPGLAGDTLIREAIAARPELRGRIVVHSGIAFSDELEDRLFGELGCARLDKGSTIEEFERVVGAIVYGGERA